MAAKADYLQTGVTLEELDGYGAAKDWGWLLRAICRPTAQVV